MKKYIITILTGIFALGLVSSCRKDLSLAPVSSITDGNFFQTAGQFDAFMVGIHAGFRSHTESFQRLGEMRADEFGTEPGSGSAFTGEATQGVEKLWTQALTLDYAGVNNFGVPPGGGNTFYYTINQINLMISKLNTSTVVAPATKSAYLGMCYGLRAFYYFQIYRTWGNAIIQTDPTTGSTIDLSALAKAASPQADVLALIKADIDLSASNFGSNYAFTGNKTFWSKSATLMLKAEVYLFTSSHGGGTADAATAQAALTDIQTNVPSLQLQASYPSVFTVKGNNEMIFVTHYLNTELAMTWIPASFTPQTSLIINFSDSLQNRQFNTITDNWAGLLRAPIKISTYRQFSPLDSRRGASIQAAYNKVGGNYQIAGCFVNKYQGTQVSGARSYDNDWPIYRYADLLLLLAEAKVDQGLSPVTEINLVRARAYGANYNAATIGYPNQAIDANPREAILQERLLEFIFEGKRWYDLRRMGDSYVYAHTTVPASKPYLLLWPIDRNTLTNNTLLTQTPGYPSF